MATIVKTMETIYVCNQKERKSQTYLVCMVRYAKLNGNESLLKCLTRHETICKVGKAVFYLLMEINFCLLSNVACLKLQPPSTQEKLCR